jgi:hypothetical protein
VSKHQGGSKDGEWVVRPCRGGFLVETAEGGRVVRGSGGVANHAEAVLIAASPRMLQALKAVARELGRARPEVFRSFGEECLSLIQDALVRAGEALP